MSSTKTMTADQEALLPVYQEKWRAIAHSTTAIDPQKVIDAVHTLYQLKNLDSPAVLFYQSPQDTTNCLRRYSEAKIAHELGLARWFDLKGELEESLRNGLLAAGWTELAQTYNFRTDRFGSTLAPHLTIAVWSGWLRELETPLGDLRRGQVIKPEAWASFAAFTDFCISVLGVSCNMQLWATFQKIVCECGWLYPFEKAVLACNRPTELLFDPQYRPHAEAKPAISFADGLSVYAYHGVHLPEHYGQLPPSEWKSEWILDQRNAELRRVLIQAIGFTRICDELNAISLDSWREYTLVQIPTDTGFVERRRLPLPAMPTRDDQPDLSPEEWFDLQRHWHRDRKRMPREEQVPIYFLQMTCPSTGHIHTIRVPPEMQSAREAARWINHDIDPEEFATET